MYDKILGAINANMFGDLLCMGFAIILCLDLWWWCWLYRCKYEELFVYKDKERRESLKMRWVDVFKYTILLVLYSALLGYVLILQIPLVLTYEYDPSALHLAGLVLTSYLIGGFTCLYAKTIGINVERWPIVSRFTEYIITR